MARKVPTISLILSLVLCNTGAVLALSVTEQTVLLVHRSSAPLQPSEYEAVISLQDGTRLKGRIKVAPSHGGDAPTASVSVGSQAAGPRGPEPAVARPPVAEGSVQSESLLVIGLAVGAIGILAAAGAFYYFRIIVPRRQTGPYQQALELLQSKRYEQALPQLTKIEGKLPDDLRNDCRFYIAFVRQQLGELERAAADLETLHQEDPTNGQVSYLLAYVFIENDDLKKAEIVLEQLEKGGKLSVLETRRMLGIVKFRRACLELKEGRIDAAEDLFEKVKSLGDFEDRIPRDLRDRNLVLGTKALFNRDTQEARELFSRLAGASGPDSAENLLLAQSRVGLALADWIDDRPSEEVEKQLVEAARLIDPSGSLSQAWKGIGKSEREDPLEKLEELEAAEGTEGAETDTRAASGAGEEFARMLRDIHFMRAMNAVRNWGQADGDMAYKVMPETYRAVMEILARVRALDARFSDACLATGMLMYYLHKPGQEERGQGIDLLQEAQRLGMREPAALEIINAREKARQNNKGAVDTYLQVLDKYINDATVRQEVRQRLIAQRRRFQRTVGDQKRNLPERVRVAAPTLDEMQQRTSVLLQRVNQILQGQQDSETTELSQLCAEIQRGSEALAVQAQQVERSEVTLLERTGNQLFKD